MTPNRAPGLALDRRERERLRGRPVLQQKTIYHFLILVRHLRVSAEFVVARSAGEVCAFRMYARAEFAAATAASVFRHVTLEFW